METKKNQGRGMKMKEREIEIEIEIEIEREKTSDFRACFLGFECEVFDSFK